jgi:hypothetical protein
MLLYELFNKAVEIQKTARAIKMPDSKTDLLEILKINEKSELATTDFFLVVEPTKKIVRYYEVSGTSGLKFGALCENFVKVKVEGNSKGCTDLQIGKFQIVDVLNREINIDLELVKIQEREAYFINKTKI